MRVEVPESHHIVTTQLSTLDDLDSIDIEGLKIPNIDGMSVILQVGGQLAEADGVRRQLAVLLIRRLYQCDSGHAPLQPGGTQWGMSFRSFISLHSLQLIQFSWVLPDVTNANSSQVSGPHARL